MKSSFEEQIAKYKQFPELTAYIARMNDGSRIIFLHEYNNLNDFSKLFGDIVVRYPLSIQSNKGELDFAQYAEFGQEDVLINFSDKKSLAKPVDSIAIAYYMAVRRIRFAIENVELADKIMSMAITNMASSKSNNSLTESDLKKAILNSLDLIIDSADGDYSDEIIDRIMFNEQAKTEVNNDDNTDSNIVDIKDKIGKGSTILH